MVKVEYDKKKKEWITLPNNSKEGMYLDGTLKILLDKAKKIIKKDWDMIFIVDGYEGLGKSVFAQQMGYYLDPTLNLDRVCFTPKEFIEAVKKAKKYQCVIYDEAFGGLSSRAYFSQTNKALVSMLMQIRQKNLYVIIVNPSFFELDKYIVLWRSRALIHIYSPKDDPFKRGTFAFFDQRRKKLLFMNGRKFYTYFKPPANFLGNFTNYYPLNEQEYRRRKLLAAEKRKVRVSSERVMAQRNVLLWILQKKLGFPQTFITELLEDVGETKISRQAIDLASSKVDERVELLKNEGKLGDILEKLSVSKVLNNIRYLIEKTNVKKAEAPKREVLINNEEEL